MTAPKSWLREPSRVPSPKRLRAAAAAAALLDEILEPRADVRAHLFDEAWGEGEELATIRNGQGDFAFVWFAPAGTVIRGFDHESAMSPYRVRPPRPWEGMFDGLPAELAYANEEPAFALDEVTFCLWRTRRARKWHVGSGELPRGRDPDGSGALLRVIDGGPSAYVRYAREYFEREVPEQVIAEAYRGRVTESAIETLNPAASPSTVLQRASALGLSVGSGSGGGSVAKKPGKSATRKKPTEKPKAVGEAPKRRRKPGRAQFTVETSDGEVRLVVNGKAISRSSHDPRGLYAAVFDRVKELIEAGDRG